MENTHQVEGDSEKLICPHCGKEFSTDRTDVKYCSPQCKQRAENSASMSAIERAQKARDGKK